MLFPWEPWEKGRAAGMRHSWHRGSSPELQPRAELELYLWETHALNSSTLPAFPPLCSRRSEQNVGGKRGKKKKKSSEWFLMVRGAD